MFSKAPERLVVGVGCLCAVTALSRQASADAELVVEDPSGCTDAAALRASVERVAGRSFANLSAGFSRVEVAIANRGERLIVALVASDGATTERVVETASCAEAADAAVVVLATSLSAAAEPSTGEPPDGLEAAPVEAPNIPAPFGWPASEPPVDPAESERPRSERAHPAVSTGVRFGPSIGLLPEAALLFDLSVGLSWPALDVALRAGAQGASALHFETPPGGGAEIDLLRVSGVGCLVAEQGSLRPALCGGLEVGRLRASGYGVENPRQSETLWWAALLGGRAGWVAAPQFSVVLEAELAATLETYDVVVVPGYGHRLSRFAFRPLLGLELIW